MEKDMRIIPPEEISDYINAEVNVMEQRVVVDALVLSDMLGQNNISALKDLNDRLGFNLKKLAHLYMVCALEHTDLSFAYISQALRVYPDFKISEKVRMDLSANAFIYDGVTAIFRRTIILTYTKDMVVSINSIIENVRTANNANHKSQGYVSE